jgi:hypothetical protein
MMCRSLYPNMATKEQNGLEVKKMNSCQCARLHLLRSNAPTVERKGEVRTQVQSARVSLCCPSQPYDSIASSYAPWWLFAFERGVYDQTHASLRSNA